MGRTMLRIAGIIGIIIAIIAALIAIMKMIKHLLLWGLIITVVIVLAGLALSYLKKKIDEDNDGATGQSS
jgi:hypothetical protein